MIERLAIVSAAMIAALVGVVLVRRRIPHDALKENNDFAGLAYAMIAAIYGVYLAFTVVVVWEQFGEAERNATSEAVYLSQVWRDVQVLPAEVRDPLQRQLLAYASSVVDHEWGAMAEEGLADPRTAAIYEELWRDIYAARLHVAAPADVAFFEEAVRQMNELGMSRRLRLLSAGARLPPIMWTLLVAGGVLTVVFTFTFGTRSAWVQGSMTAAMAGLIVFSLLIVAALQHPFAGDVRVTPEAMNGVRRSLHERALGRVGFDAAASASR